jgi:hypothetical protein
MHAPPGTALYHERHEGWTVADHLLTDALEILDWVAWTKTVDAQQKRPRKKPKPRQRPGRKTDPKKAAEDNPMTVADYVALTGMVIDLEGRE